MTDVTFDITERWRLEEQRQLTPAKPNQRVKNMTALVHSVVNISAREATSV